MFDEDIDMFSFVRFTAAAVTCRLSCRSTGLVTAVFGPSRRKRGENLGQNWGRRLSFRALTTVKFRQSRPKIHVSCPPSSVCRCRRQSVRRASL